MNKILITGITGQDGIFLTEKILSSYPEAKIYGISRSYNYQSFFEKIDFTSSEAVQRELVNFLQYEEDYGPIQLQKHTDIGCCTLL